MPSAHGSDAIEDRVLGEFRILRRLGRGGMADVYLAEQTSLHRHVAVKVLRSENLSDDVHLERFRREAKAAGGLNHANIVQVYTIGEEDGVHYIAQEYVQGLNLREFLQRKGPPDVMVALHIMKQVAVALQVAGEAGIVHRDIKPENIMVTRKGKVKVTDFGLAQLSLGGEALHLTQAGMTMGTPLYMSPEQVNGKKLDQRSDIYSFGVTCYHLLAGRPPFEGETAMGVAVQHLNSRPLPLDERRPDLPVAVCRIVHKMMGKMPDQRYRDAGAVLEDLRRVEKSITENPAAGAVEITIDDFDPLSKSRALMPTKVFHSLWHRARGHLLLLFLGSILLVTLLSAAITWSMRPQDPRNSPAYMLPAKATIGKQFESAKRLVDDEDAWLAVIAHKLPDPNYIRPAKEQLALLYLRTSRYNDAERIFDEFSALDDEEYQTKGNVGTAVIASLKGDHQRSREIIESRQLLSAEHVSPGSELGQLLREASKHNLAALGRGADPGSE